MSTTQPEQYGYSGEAHSDNGASFDRTNAFPAAYTYMGCDQEVDPCNPLAVPCYASLFFI
jgi:hypothetical protein